MFIVMFCAGSCGAAERVALMLEGADPKALPNSFNGLCYSGLEKARERYGRRIQTKVYNSYGDDNILAPLLRSASSESDLVIITSALYIPALKEMKKDFPECSYIVFDSRDIKGVTNIIFREEEGGFLAGALRPARGTPRPKSKCSANTRAALWTARASKPRRPSSARRART